MLRIGNTYPAKALICSIKLVTPNGVRVECGSIQEAINLLRRLEYQLDTESLRKVVHGSKGTTLDTPIVSLEELEAAAIRNALQAELNNKSRAAKRLGISRTTLMRKMIKYEICVHDSAA